uniref:Uncharacterized protein n=1 Tax=Lactuca sativa TaxID=4236 RepID=A0A9R1W6S1_LACSA|nr:hypothetical protein LSAT_V11C200080860 [Lactuca sativa]
MVQWKLFADSRLGMMLYEVFLVVVWTNTFIASIRSFPFTIASSHTGHTSGGHRSLIRLRHFMLCLRHSTSPPPPGHQVPAAPSSALVVVHFWFLVSH